MQTVDDAVEELVSAVWAAMGSKMPTVYRERLHKALANLKLGFINDLATIRETVEAPDDVSTIDAVRDRMAELREWRSRVEQAEREAAEARTHAAHYKDMEALAQQEIARLQGVALDARREAEEARVHREHAEHVAEGLRASLADERARVATLEDHIREINRRPVRHALRRIVGV